MARAHRHFFPGYIWHLTHRCHKREFLLKFSRDRYRWMQLLFEARQRYGLSILNFVVTCNHIHLIVTDNGNSGAISKTMQYVAGRTGQEYNRRKNRKGAFWEDRYHATAIESGNHLRQCLVYIDLNMVRAGVVDHPDQWKWGGYHEIRKPKERYRIIDHARLQRLLKSNTHEDLAESYKQWVDSKLAIKQSRQQHFSSSIAVGSEAFLAGVKEALGICARGRKIVSDTDDGFHLKEPMPAYGKSTDALNNVYCKEDLEGIQVPWNIGTT